MTRARNSANLASDGNLFVDISNDRTGIGSVAPAQNLHVAGTAGFHADTTFVGDLYNATWDRSDNSLKFVSNAKAKFGNSNQLEVNFESNSGNSVIKHTSNLGSLVLHSDNLDLRPKTNVGAVYLRANYNDGVDLYFANSKKWETTAYGTNTTGTAVNDGLVVAGVATVTTMNVTGVLTYDDVTSVDSVGIVTAREGVHIPDNKRLDFGGTAGDGDFEIRHTNGNTFIENNTGAFYITQGTAASSNPLTIYGGNELRLKHYYSNGGELFALKSVRGYQTEIYWQGSERVRTASYGIQVTGTTDTDGLVVSGITTFSNATTIVNGGYHRGIINSGAQEKIIGGYISGSDTLRLGESMYLTSTGLGINESNPGHRLTVGGDGYFGFTTPNDAARQIIFNANRGSAGQTLANINWQWNSKKRCPDKRYSWN